MKTLIHAQSDDKLVNSLVCHTYHANMITTMIYIIFVNWRHLKKNHYPHWKQDFIT